MLPRLVQSPLRWRRAFPPIARHALPRPVNPRGFPPQPRPFSSSRLRNQTYRYRRFGDPEPSPGHSSGSSQGPTSSWVGRFNLFWRRLTRIQQLFLVGIGGGAPVFYVSHLETVPESGRRRFIFMSEAMEKEMGQATFKQVMAQFGSKVLPDSHPYTQMCKRVVSRLGPATGKDGVDWRVYVIDQPSVPNAFVIPGGQIFVFTGILPIAQNEAGLATILGHEIAHYTLRHIAEKTSLKQFVMIIGVTTFWFLGLPIDWFFQIQHIGLELPNSRACETEADYVGLLYMAKACYDPREGPRVWQRMSQMAKGQPHIPQFLSTHPENADREQRLTSHIQEALDKGAEAGCSERRDFGASFQRAAANQFPTRSH